MWKYNFDLPKPLRESFPTIHFSLIKKNELKHFFFFCKNMAGM